MYVLIGISYLLSYDLNSTKNLIIILSPFHLEVYTYLLKLPCSFLPY